MKPPNFFIVGAMRAGTTSVYNYLKQHPDVYMCPVKEPNYFCSDIDTNSFRRDYKILFDDIDIANKLSTISKVHMLHINDWKTYCTLYKNAHHQKAVGEASVSYLYSRVAARNIKDRFNEAKIIMFLRNPVERAYSHYLMELRDGLTAMPFRKSVETDIVLKRKGWGISRLYIELGMYYEQVRRYINIYDKEHLRIYLYEDLQNVQELNKDLSTYLGVDSSFMPDMSIRYNVSRVPVFAPINRLLKSPSLRPLARICPQKPAELVKRLLLSKNNPSKLKPEDKIFMQSLYCQDVGKLSHLINRDLAHWLS